MTQYDDTRVITLLREVPLPPAPPDRLTQVGRRARAHESRAMTGVAGALALVLVAGLFGLSSLRGDDAGRQVLTVAGAAQATTDAGSARITMRMTFDGLPVPEGTPSSSLVTLTGVVDFVREAMLLRGSIAGQTVEIRALGKDSWQRTVGRSDAKWEHSTTENDDEFARIDPTTLLTALTAAGETLGTTRQGDRTVFRMRVPSDFFNETAPAEGLMDVRVTVDPDGLVRELVFVADQGDGVRVTSAMTFDDFGVAVDVRPPPAGQVVTRPSGSDSGSGTGELHSEVTVGGTAPSMPPEQACAMLASLQQQADAETQEAMAPMLAELREQCAKK